MILVNGTAQSVVDTMDRGVHYGDGLFETMAMINGRVRCWEGHWQRLRKGCERLAIPCPDRVLVEQEIAMASQDEARQVVKLLLTRGSSSRGYRAPPDITPRRILMTSSWPEYASRWARDGVRVRLCQTRLGHNPALAGIKHCNRLEQILARREWQNEVEEGLMQDTAGNIIEGTMSNIFLIHDERLVTPRLDRCGVAGVTRERIIARAPGLGIAVREVQVTLEQVRQASGLFLCSTLLGLCPVRKFEDRDYPISPLLTTLRTIEGLELS